MMRTNRRGHDRAAARRAELSIIPSRIPMVLLRRPQAIAPFEDARTLHRPPPFLDHQPRRFLMHCVPRFSIDLCHLLAFLFFSCITRWSVRSA
jgi:hypothetical protein